MNKFLFEEMSSKLQGIANGFLFARSANIETKSIYDAAKDVAIDNFGADADIIMSPTCKITIRTAVKDTTDWRTAFVQLAQVMAATDAEQKSAMKNATNNVTATTIRVEEPKGRKPKKGGK